MKKVFTQQIIKMFIIFISTLFLAKTSFAYLSLSETGELIKENNFRIGVAPQFILTGGGASKSGESNAGVFLDLPIQPDMNARINVGSGSTADFWTSASLKWVPYPDYKKQPAIGGRAAFIYARKNSSTTYNLQLTPIFSKIIESQWGKLVPYAGLPLTFSFGGSKNTSAIQFVVGAEWIEKPDYQVGAELDMSLSEAPTAITFHVNFPFDSKIGFRR